MESRVSAGSFYGPQPREGEKLLLGDVWKSEKGTERLGARGPFGVQIRE